MDNTAVIDEFVSLIGRYDTVCKIKGISDRDKEARLNKLCLCFWIKIRGNSSRRRSKRMEN